jgi:hypothetical protein
MAQTWWWRGRAGEGGGGGREGEREGKRERSSTYVMVMPQVIVHGNDTLVEWLPDRV